MTAGSGQLDDLTKANRDQSTYQSHIISYDAVERLRPIVESVAEGRDPLPQSRLGIVRSQRLSSVRQSPCVDSSLVSENSAGKGEAEGGYIGQNLGDEHSVNVVVVDKDAKEEEESKDLAVLASSEVGVTDEDLATFVLGDEDVIHEDVLLGDVQLQPFNAMAKAEAAFELW